MSIVSNEERRDKQAAYQSIANVLSVVLLRAPDYAIAGEVGSKPLEWLPCQINLAVAGSIEVGPEERCLVFGDLRGGHQPFRNLVQIDTCLVGIMVRGNQVSMAQLLRR